MTVYYEIPIIDAPYQDLQTVLNSVSVGLAFNWNEWLGRWTMNVSIDDELKVAGIRMVPGTDLVRGFGFGIGKLVLWDWSERGGNPGRAELPSGEFRLIAAY